ncbi:MAG: LytTR family DNA-binding domain-containing protein [bacterium]
MKYRTLLVEDELPSMERMKHLLSKFPEIEIVGQAEDGLTAVKLILDLKPDLIFLDICLPELSGFQVLEQITHHPKVIFVTAHDKYAIKAFEENAVDYLLKPTSEERIKKAIDKLKLINDKFDPQLLSILKNMIDKDRYPSSFSVKLKEEILLVPINSVYWFYSADKYVFLQTFEHVYFLDYTLRELEEVLDPNKFLRIHKSIIVSTEHMNKIKKSFTGKYSAVMNDIEKTSLEIGRTYLPLVKERYHF